MSQLPKPFDQSPITFDKYGTIRFVSTPELFKRFDWKYCDSMNGGEYNCKWDIVYLETEKEYRYTHPNHDACLSWEIVHDMTSDNILAELTVDDATQLLSKAKSIGYSVPATLTPEKFLSVHNNIKQELLECL